MTLLLTNDLPLFQLLFFLYNFSPFLKGKDTICKTTKSWIIWIYFWCETKCETKCCGIVSKFIVVYSPFFRQRHVRQLLFNTKFDFIDALIFRFVNFFHLWKSCNKNLSSDYCRSHCVTGKSQQFVSGRTVRTADNNSVWGRNSRCKRGLFIRLLFNKSCECDKKIQESYKIECQHVSWCTTEVVDGTDQDGYRLGF